MVGIDNAKSWYGLIEYEMDYLVAPTLSKAIAIVRERTALEETVDVKEFRSMMSDMKIDEHEATLVVDDCTLIWNIILGSGPGKFR